MDETALLKIISKFESDYKDTLSRYESDVNEANYKMAYDLGADIKHALEDIVNEISSN